MTRHDPYRAERETKRLESLEQIKPAFKAEIDARVERDFLAVMRDIPTPRINPICQKDGS